MISWLLLGIGTAWANSPPPSASASGAAAPLPEPTHKIWLTESRRLSGVELAGHSAAWLYPGDRLARGTLARNQLVSGMPLANDTEVYFFAGGQLQEGTLAEPFRVGGFLAQGRIRFYVNGKVDELELANAQDVPDKPGKSRCERGDHLLFDRFGNYLGWEGHRK